MKKTEYAVFQNSCLVYAEHLQMFECRTKPVMLSSGLGCSWKDVPFALQQLCSVGWSNLFLTPLIPHSTPDSQN